MNDWPVCLDGFLAHWTWEHSATVRELYARRCRGEEPEMDAHAQACDLLAERLSPGDVILDVGCGSGYFWRSLKARGLDATYYGVDAAPSLIQIGRNILAPQGLPPARLLVGRIEDLAGEVDHVLCINVISNIDNFHRPLERMLIMARRSVIVRESIGEGADYRYVLDEYLDPDVKLSVHVNRYDKRDMSRFCEDRGFAVQFVTDRRTGGRPEVVVGYPHHWTFLVADRHPNARETRIS
jgi:SAM-dependent methyltransferase